VKLFANNGVQRFNVSPRKGVSLNQLETEIRKVCQDFLITPEGGEATMTPITLPKPKPIPAERKAEIETYHQLLNNSVIQNGNRIIISPYTLIKQMGFSVEEALRLYEYLKNKNIIIPDPQTKGMGRKQT
jgi:hypothetical protein